MADKITKGERWIIFLISIIIVVLVSPCVESLVSRDIKESTTIVEAIKGPIITVKEVPQVPQEDLTFDLLALAAPNEIAPIYEPDEIVIFTFDEMVVLTNEWINDPNFY
jgi:hypothetical protein